MAEMKVYLSEELDKRFRKAAMTVYGYGRGSISKAAEEALLEWCRNHEALGSVPSQATPTSEDSASKTTPNEKEERVQPAKVRDESPQGALSSSGAR